MLVLDERVRGMNYEDDVHLRRNVEASSIKVRNFKSVSHEGVLSYSFKKKKHASVLVIYLVKSDVSYVRRSRVCRLAIRGHHVLHDDCYVHI